jgi:hypothetical protein
VKAALVAARGAGAAIRFVRLPDLAIGQCRGCFKCLGPEAKCAIEDDLAGLLQAADVAGGLILASPVYFGLPPACLVSLLDRLLVRTPREGSALADKCAVTVTVMGNRKWRGLAGPVANMTAGLLGFDLAASWELVAEGPGEVLSLPGAEDRLALAGRMVAGEVAPAGSADAVALDPDDGRPAPGGRLAGRCPTCRSDFFRIGQGALECPVCGTRGDLAVYLKEGGFEKVDCEPRWGRPWLKGHVASWIEPSIQRYKARRKDILRGVADLKRRYSEVEEGE